MVFKPFGIVQGFNSKAILNSLCSSSYRAVSTYEYDVVIDFTKVVEVYYAMARETGASLFRFNELSAVFRI